MKPAPYVDDTYSTIAQIWANKYLMSRQRVPVPTGEFDVREANYAAQASSDLLELAHSAAAKIGRDTGQTTPPTADQIRGMAAAIAAEVVKADDSQARVDRTVASLLQM
jgi:hypothetical protein